MSDDRRAIEDLLVEFAYQLDIGRGQRVHELFEPDGVYVIDGEAVNGQREIREGYERRAARGPRTARHIFTNVRITLETADRATVASIMTLYAADGEPVHEAALPLVVGDFNDVCVRGGDGVWRFERRELTSLFRSGEPVRPPTATEE
jgi:uncharacterized protein (TIGR02246 family)